jgi:nitric oxide dioxygenase
VTPADVTLVQSSFRKILPIAGQAIALFYARLFELDPALRALFRGDIDEQGRKLISLLAAAVASLDHPEVMLDTVRSLGARHLRDGVIQEHYASVGAALIWTLHKGLGPEFTPAVCDAWTHAYTQLAHTMIAAQRSTRVAA